MAGPATDPHYDVFLSHNSKDKPAVERIANKLRELGFEPWLDKWHLAAGQSFQAGIESGLRASNACAVFFGPHGPGAWQKAELEVAQDRAVKDPDFRLFLVLLPGVPEPFDATVLPAFLNMRTWVDLRPGYEDPQRFQPLVSAIAGLPIGPGALPERDESAAPYRGLQVFDEEHAEFFHGREADVQRLLEKLKSSRFLAVVGPSGSGKSSLVRAGLLPALRNGALPGSHDWPVRVFKPGARPLDALAAQLVQLAPDRPMGRTLDELRDSPRTLDLAATLLLDGRPPATRLLLVIDQFEEVFTLCHSEEDRVQFLDNILHAATVPDGRCVVVLTLRADFYPRCAAYPELAALMSAHQALVGPLDERGLRAVIVEPARQVGLSFEPGLVETILGDMGREPGALPLLEHALLELWERRQGTMMTLAGYRDSGGVGKAIANRADAIFESLSAAEQAVARRVLMRLTQPGEQTEDTRRRADLGELVTRPEEQAAVGHVVDQLVAARLLTTGQDTGDGSPQVDVAHEALIRAWPRLRGWLDEDREGLLVHNRLTETTQEWERLGRDHDALYRGARLTEAQALAARHPDLLNEPERAFLAASVELRDRELAEERERQAEQDQQRRRILIGLAAFSLVALVLAAIAGIQWRAAEAGTTRADAAAAAARAAQATAEAESDRADAAAAAALAAQGTAEAEARRADEEAAIAVAAQSTAESEARRADDEAAAAVTAREEAEAQREVAADERDNAVLQATAASLARDRAETQERIARSRQLAAQSRTVGRPDLALQLGRESVRLDPGAPETRGSLLTTLATNPRLGAVLPAHAGQILGLAFSPDGAQVATAGADGILQIWDATTLEPVGDPLIAEPLAVLSGLAYSPDGTMLLVGGDVGAVLFDLTSENPAETFQMLNEDNPAGVSDVAFSPGSPYLAFATDQGVTLWDLAANAPAGEPIPGGDDGFFRIDFSPDGSLLAVPANRGVQLWEVATREPVGDLMQVDDATWLEAAFSPDGGLLAIGTGFGVLSVWDVATQEPAYPAWQGHDGFIFDLDFSPDGTRLASAGNDGTVKLWDVATQSLALGPWAGHDSGVFVLDFRPDGLNLASAGVDGALVLWNLSSNTAIGTILPESPDYIFGLSFRPDGQRLAAAARNAGIEIWNLETGGLEGEPLVGHSGAVWDVAYNPAGTMLLSGGEDGVLLWDMRLASPVAERLTGFDGEAAAVAVSPDGQWLAAAGNAGTVVWDALSLEQTHVIPTDNDISFAYGVVAISPDSTMLATADADGAVSIWALPGGEPIAMSDASLGTTILTLAFHPDGRQLALGGTNGFATIINPTNGTEVGEPIRVSDGLVWAMTFSQDGTELVAGGEHGVLVWDLANRAPIGEPLVREGNQATQVFSLALSPDGERLAVGGVANVEGVGGGIMIWDITLDRWIAAACGIVRGQMDLSTWTHYLGDEPYQQTCPPGSRPVLPPPSALPPGDPAATPLASPVG